MVNRIRESQEQRGGGIILSPSSKICSQTNRRECEHGVFVDNTPGTQDGVDRWVCNHCGDDLPLDQGDIIEHLEDYHQDKFV